MNLYKNPLMVMTRLILLINKLNEHHVKFSINSENLTKLDILSSHPFTIFTKDNENKIYLELAYLGFPENSLEYQNIYHIVKNYCFQKELNHLVAFSLIDLIKNKEYRITPHGINIANQFRSDYAIKYQKSFDYILTRFLSLNDEKFAVQFENSINNYINSKSFL